MAHNPFQGLQKLMPKNGGKPGTERPKVNANPKESSSGAKPMPESGEGGAQTHTIEQHPDGHLVSHMEGGASIEHPDHMHMLAHLGHHITGGDKHHIMHHDGMTAHSHMIHEDGQHEGPQDHNSAEDAKASMDKFFGEEAQEPEHQGGAPEHDTEQAMGGM